MEPQAILGQIRWIALMLFALVAVDCYSRFFIANQGHVMGAKIEYDMRAEIFAHFQKLSFSFYDDQKVGQLMSLSLIHISTLRAASHQFRSHTQKFRRRDVYKRQT